MQQTRSFSRPRKNNCPFCSYTHVGEREYFRARGDRGGILEALDPTLQLDQLCSWNQRYPFILLGRFYFLHVMQPRLREVHVPCMGRISCFIIKTNIPQAAAAAAEKHEQEAMITHRTCSSNRLGCNSGHYADSHALLRAAALSMKGFFGLSSSSTASFWISSS